MTNPTVCVVVAVRNRLELTKRFLESFKKSTYQNFTIVITDDASTDNTVEYVSQNYPEVVILHGNGNLFWTGATNKGVKYALEHNFDYVLTINNDAVVKPDTLAKLVECSIKNPGKIVGSLIVRGDTGKIWSAGVYLNWKNGYLFNLNHPDEDLKIVKTLQNPLPAEILNGNGTLFPTDIFRKIGIYNEFWTPHYHADSEITLRATKAGIKSIVCLDAIVINEIRTTPLNNGRRELVFAKKSDYYWKPLLYFFVKYCPNGYRNSFFRQYYHFFKDFKIVRGIGKMYDKIFLNGRFTNAK